MKNQIQLTIVPPVLPVETPQSYALTINFISTRMEQPNGQQEVEKYDATEKL